MTKKVFRMGSNWAKGNWQEFQRQMLFDQEHLKSRKWTAEKWREYRDGMNPERKLSRAVEERLRGCVTRAIKKTNLVKPSEMPREACQHLVGLARGFFAGSEKPWTRVFYPAYHKQFFRASVQKRSFHLNDSQVMRIMRAVIQETEALWVKGRARRNSPNRGKK